MGGRRHLILDHALAREEDGVAGGRDRGEQAVGAIQTRKDVAESAAPADPRTLGRSSLPCRLLIVVREQIGGEGDGAGLELGLCNRADQRADIRNNGQAVSIEQRLELTERLEVAVGASVAPL